MMFLRLETIIFPECLSAKLFIMGRIQLTMPLPHTRSLFLLSVLRLDRGCPLWEKSLWEDGTPQLWWLMRISRNWVSNECVQQLRGSGYPVISSQYFFWLTFTYQCNGSKQTCTELHLFHFAHFYVSLLINYSHLHMLIFLPIRNS